MATKTARRPKELAEMERLTEGLQGSVNSTSLGLALAKRAYLKRGREALEKHLLIDECPATERPYAVFFDTVHTLVLQERMRMAGVGNRSTSGDFRGLEQELPRLWPSVYGKQAEDVNAGGVVIRIERPPRRDPDEAA